MAKDLVTYSIDQWSSVAVDESHCLVLEVVSPNGDRIRHTVTDADSVRWALDAGRAYVAGLERKDRAKQRAREHGDG